jgi:ferredoxin--NADP+ reductase
MFKVIASKMIVPNIYLLTIEAPDVAREVNPGQFVILRANEEGERTPLSLSDWDRDLGTITVILMNIGYTTDQLSNLDAGMYIPTVVGPLGKATEIEKYGTVICLGGCYGMGSIFPIARALKEKGNKIITILEARSSYLFYWQDRFKTISEKIIHITRDGSKGYRGHIDKLPDILQELDEPINRVIVNGCTFFMKRVCDTTKPFGLSTWVSLNPIMMDGTGMCGVCRVTIGSSTKFACVDGPDFDGHLVNWDELFQRRKMYMSEETIPYRSSKCEEHRKKI